MLIKGFYYSEAMIKDETEGYIPYRLNYRNGKIRVAYEWDESLGVYKSKDGDFIRKEKAERLVKEEELRPYYYKVVIDTDNVMKIIDFVTEEEARAFVKAEVTKFLENGVYNISTKVEKQ